MGHLQQHYSMVKVIAMVFGEKKEEGIKVNEMKSSEQAVSALNSFFGANG